jgi:hypothetical protein
MRSWIILITVLASRVASAQPGVTPATPAPVVLTANEERLLDEGLISGDRIAAGVVLSAMLPFGAGQAAEGRWWRTGYLFAIADGALIAGLVATVNEPRKTEPCGDVGFCVDSWRNVVIMLMLSVKALEIVDASVGPHVHNNRVRAVRSKLGQPLDDEARLIPFIVPTDHSGGVAGVALRF